ncbi:MAG: hypothetical protein FLDDKLPJ_02412 [Phycisphaerae bacterium]|nr:hypothetical protein [Phycisphaerae bacterium]
MIRIRPCRAGAALMLAFAAGRLQGVPFVKRVAGGPDTPRSA